MVNRWHLLLGIAFGLTFAAMVLICLAMGTDVWVKYDVDREALKVDLNGDLTVYEQLFSHKIYWTRYRGLYRFCYTDDEYPTYFSDGSKREGDTICDTEQGYAFDSADNLTYIEPNADAKDDYTNRNHLLRTVTAMFVLSLIGHLVGFCISVVATCKERINGLRIATFLSFVAALFCACGMAMFHIIHEMENNTIKLEQFKAGWNSLENHQFLSRHTDISFGYSYMIGWIAVGLSFFAFIFYLFTIFSLTMHINQMAGMVPMRGGPAHPEYASQVRPKSYTTPAPTTSTDPYVNKRRSAADELYYASDRRNMAYDIVGDYRRIMREDKPGQDEEINRQIKPVRPEHGRNESKKSYVDEEPGSWYKKSLQPAEGRPKSEHNDRHQSRSENHRDGGRPQSYANHHRAY